MISSIQLREEVKRQLASYKEKDNESFEDVIVRLIKTSESQKRRQNELLIEQCKVMAEDDLRMTKEWENTDNTIDWEW